MFKTPQYDLEEVLSILQAEQEFGKTSDADRRKDAFVRLIADVVNDSAMRLPEPISTGNWRGYVTATGGWQNYITFVASLFRLQFISAPGLPTATQLGHGLLLKEPYCYDVVSLNYDCILEEAAHVLDGTFGRPSPWISFEREDATKDDVIPATGQHRPRLAKLHGCSKAKTIIAPTANKQIVGVRGQWEMAYDVLMHANHIRVIGYSLPEGDAAVRYLLKSAMAKMEHPKTFDVLCLDPDGAVERRYRDFINFHKHRFKAGDTTAYLRSFLAVDVRIPNVNHSIAFNSTEKQHETFFSETP